jgi:hypothetical protein
MVDNGIHGRDTMQIQAVKHKSLFSSHINGGMGGLVPNMTKLSS